MWLHYGTNGCYEKKMYYGIICLHYEKIYYEKCVCIMKNVIVLWKSGFYYEKRIYYENNVCIVKKMCLYYEKKLFILRKEVYTMKKMLLLWKNVLWKIIVMKNMKNYIKEKPFPFHSLTSLQHSLRPPSRPSLSPLPPSSCSSSCISLPSI